VRGGVPPLTGGHESGAAGEETRTAASRAAQLDFVFACFVPPPGGSAVSLAPRLLGKPFHSKIHDRPEQRIQQAFRPDQMKRD